MSLLLKTNLSLARDALKRNRGRSFLTCLGIAIGVAATILILSLMGSAARLITDGTKDQANLLIVQSPSTLTLNDTKELDKLSEVQAVAPLAYSTNTLKADRDTRVVNSAEVVATSADLEKIMDLKIHDGSFLTDPKNNSDPNPTAVLGLDLALELFGSRNPIGQTFTLLGTRFIVVGILEPKAGLTSFNHTALVSASALDQLENLQIQTIYLQTNPKSKDPENKVKQTLLALKSGDTNWTVSPAKDVKNQTQNQIQNQETLQIFQNMLVIVAGVSILIGGIGIMNIMLVAVAERTHEIGIRKALGATNFNIATQFLFESLIISCLGGILGLILGYLLAFLASIFTPFPPFISLEILLAVLYISIVSGTLFGLYPALKASKKPPIDSLKSY